MSTQRLHPRPESSQNRPATEPDPDPAATPSAEPADSPTDRAPATFSRGNRERLRNLIDEWNAGFAAAGTDAE